MAITHSASRKIRKGIVGDSEKGIVGLPMDCKRKQTVKYFKGSAVPAMIALP